MGAIAGLHIASGAVAVLCGAIALVARKGSRLHVAGGRGFAVAMLIASALGAALGALLIETQWITFHAGVLATTLIGSGWLAARGRYRTSDKAVFALTLSNAANVLALIALAVLAATRADGTYLAYPAADYGVLATMAGLASIGDGRIALRRTVSPSARTARHLWRMCLGFFIAAGSAFTGPGAAAFPEAWQTSGALALPELAILVTMLVWLALLWRRGRRAR